MQQPKTRFGPDYAGVWTVEKAESEMPGFKFQGLGWHVDYEGYVDPGDEPTKSTVLVLELMPWNQEWARDQYGDVKAYEFLYYDGRDPRPLFKEIAEMPVREVRA